MTEQVLPAAVAMAVARAFPELSKMANNFRALIKRIQEIDPESLEMAVAANQTPNEALLSRQKRHFAG
ncbi:MAG: hypothetical protein SEPTF4163_002823 [Sporothrix epigloea]